MRLLFWRVRNQAVNRVNIAIIEIRLVEQVELTFLDTMHQNDNYMRQVRQVLVAIQC